jgi:hypothetical protein
MFNGSRIVSAINKIHPALWHLLCLAISAMVLSLILLNRSPNFLRPLGMALRSGFGLVIPATALVLYLVNRIPGRIGELLSMLGATSLCALALAGLWASGQTQSIVIAGLIPLSDATNYYMDGLRLVAGGDISHFSAMRPFFPGFLSLLLNLTDRNLMVSLAILTLIAALAFHFTAREIQRTHGAEAATFLLMVLFLYFRIHSGTSMSESLGVALGALGLALIWRAFEGRSERLAIFGIFVVAFALNVRPGTMFILPCILLWAGRVFRGARERISLRVLFFGVGAVLFAFALNSLFIRLLAGPSGTAFSNFSWALYGLASGGNSYTHVFIAHPEFLQLRDPQQSRAIYRLALDLILSEPGLAIKGCIYYWSMFFSNSWYNAFSFVGGENYAVNEAARWGMYVLCILGFIKWFSEPDDPHAGLAAVSAIGVLLSVPFVPPTDGYRVRLYAATIIAFGLLPGMGIAFIKERLKLKLFSAPDPEIQKTNVTALFSAFLVATILFAPFMTRMAGSTPPKDGISCPQAMDKTLIRFDAGTSIHVVRENVRLLDWMPYFHLSLFRQSVHGLADIHLIHYLEKIAPSTSIFYSLDHLSNREALIVIPTNLLPVPGTHVAICGYWELDPDLKPYNIFLAEEVIGMD